MSKHHGDDAQEYVAPVKADGLRHWQVAGAVLVDERGLLLVENLRRNGDVDWTPPGGVIDPGESPVEALTREVEEETGLVVAGWNGPLYRVEVTAPDAGFFLKVEVHRAEGFSGAVRLDDPDGIVISASFLELAEARAKLGTTQPWVSEPVIDHMTEGVTDGRVYRYQVDGGRGQPRTITRLHEF